ncbi:MAG: hypothetical protein ABLT11_10025 [Candidatus Acidiferrum sp.]
MTEEKRGPRLLPLTLLLSLLLCLFATTGGRQIFVNEMLGEAYDSQGEHFLRGDPDVDGEAIRHEAIVVDGKARMYFGPFPAFLRIILNSVYPSGRGNWSRISGICAGLIALFAFAGLIRDCLGSSPLSPRARNWVGNACVAGFALGSPLLFLLGNLSIYNEAVVWGLAWSLAALFFAWRSRNAEGRALTYSLLGFSLCAGGALLSRVTFGAPFLLIGPLLALRLPRPDRLRRLAALLLPLGAAVAFYLLLSYAKFGTAIGVSYVHYINPAHREFAHKHGIFNLARVPYGMANYFGWHFPLFQDQAPFLRADRHQCDPAIYSLPISETYLPIPWTSGWLLFGALIGIAFLFRGGRSDGFDRGIAMAFFAQVLCILSYFALAQRYAADLYPFLIFCLLLFLRSGGALLLRARYAIVALVAIAIVVNSLATVSWLVDVDPNVRADTRAIWSRFLGRESSAIKKENK